MNRIKANFRIFGFCLLMGAGFFAQSVQAAMSCVYERRIEGAWSQKILNIDGNLPIGSVIFERTLAVEVSFKRIGSTALVEDFVINGYWSNTNVQPPSYAASVYGTANGGGFLNGLGIRYTTEDGKIITQGAFLLKAGRFQPYQEPSNQYAVLKQQVVKMNDQFTKGGTIEALYAVMVVATFPAGVCGGDAHAWIEMDLNLKIPDPVQSTCTLDTKLLGVDWPPLASDELALYELSQKRSVEIVLSQCGKGVKPNIHFASYRDLSRGKYQNLVVSTTDDRIIDGLYIRLKNANNGADIRFGNPAAVTGDSSVWFNVDTAQTDKATLRQTIDIYLERTKDKLRVGPWVSNVSFIISYP